MSNPFCFVVYKTWFTTVFPSPATRVPCSSEPFALLCSFASVRLAPSCSASSLANWRPVYPMASTSFTLFAVVLTVTFLEQPNVTGMVLHLLDRLRRPTEFYSWCLMTTSTCRPCKDLWRHCSRMRCWSGPTSRFVRPRCQRGQCPVTFS